MAQGTSGNKSLAVSGKNPEDDVQEAGSKKENPTSVKERSLPFYLEEGKICQFFLDGYCKYGDECFDIHERGDEKAESKVKLTKENGKFNKNKIEEQKRNYEQSKDEWEPVICSYYLNGYCMHGKACWNSHDVEQKSKEKRRKRYNSQGEKLLNMRGQNSHEEQSKENGNLKNNNQARDQSSRKDDRKNLRDQGREKDEWRKNQRGSTYAKDDKKEKRNGEMDRKTNQKPENEKVGHWEMRTGQARNTEKDKSRSEQMDVHEEMHFLEKRMAKIKRYLETNSNKNNRQ